MPIGSAEAGLIGDYRIFLRFRCFHKALFSLQQERTPLLATVIG
jgi:hypothetical protein